MMLFLEVISVSRGEVDDPVTMVAGNRATYPGIHLKQVLRSRQLLHPVPQDWQTLLLRYVP